MQPRGRKARIAALGTAMQAYQRSTDILDDAVADRLGINRTDLRCLDFLTDGPQTVGQLSEVTALSSAATTTLVDRLEQKGLVRRVRDTSDRRKVLVEMTEQGVEEVGRCYGPLVVEGNALLERFSEDELALIHDFLVLCTELNGRHRARLAGPDRPES